MASFDVVIAGGGHNSLIVGCYLAKAGQKVCIVEKNPKTGGSVATEERIPGFLQDTCSVAHSLILGNPLMRNDELQLLSKYGLHYEMPDKLTAIYFDDGTSLEFFDDIDETCASVAKFSEKDARAYRTFVEEVYKTLDMMVMGMFSVPPAPGVQAMMMDQSPEGREMMRLQQISSWDLICEWFDHPKVRIALARYASEAMMDPFDNGTGFGFYLILPYMHKYGMGIPRGGSGELARALTDCFKDHGGTVKLDSEVVRIKIEDGEAKGLILASGEEVLASKAVVTGLHVTQVFPKMVDGFDLPADFVHRLSRIKYATLKPFVVQLALKEPVKFKVGEAISDFYWVDKSHSDIEEFAAKLKELQNGRIVRDFAAWCQMYKADPTRVPEGQGMMHIYAFAPLDLKDGGREKWDEIGEEVALGFVDDLRQQCTNLTDDNIIGMHFRTPLDIMRYNNALVEADIQHIGFYAWQLAGNRPAPGWASYRSPVPKLYMTAGSTHPGGGVTGGPGRNATQIIMEDLGLDFDSVTG
ncbi:phytoene desaturase family protein [Novosphingobium sp. BL-52-GroH]|uniref:phytoene desaturase family protein n=1 Tax=Novosphingobium sp. BL-52-GroH TaxID=3349877 RepID=UPI00384C4259